jgi:hypothetical protein
MPRSMGPKRRTLRPELTSVGRTGAPISTAESQEGTHLGLSSNPVAPIFFLSMRFCHCFLGFMRFNHASHLLVPTGRPVTTHHSARTSLVQIPSPVRTAPTAWFCVLSNM